MMMTAMNAVTNDWNHLGARPFLTQKPGQSSHNPWDISHPQGKGRNLRTNGHSMDHCERKDKICGTKDVKKV